MTLNVEALPCLGCLDTLPFLGCLSTLQQARVVSVMFLCPTSRRCCLNTRALARAQRAFVDFWNGNFDATFLSPHFQ